MIKKNILVNNLFGGFTMDNSINISDYKSKQRDITDNDLFSIFMGLVKLIKRKVANDFEESREIEINSYKDKIEVLKSEIENKDKTINLLLQRNSFLKTKKLKERQHEHEERVKNLVSKLAKYKVRSKEAIN